LHACFAAGIAEPPDIVGVDDGLFFMSPPQPVAPPTIPDTAAAINVAVVNLIGSFLS
jgi:hypothetical protein